jgi:hypothetical protein
MVEAGLELIEQGGSGNQLEILNEQDSLCSYNAVLASPTRMYLRMNRSNQVLSHWSRSVGCLPAVDSSARSSHTHSSS